tara:strand:- start:146 stop:310 length:165 start_codon:yes stop_codon:yes gene_type:complete
MDRRESERIKRVQYIVIESTTVTKTRIDSTTSPKSKLTEEKLRAREDIGGMAAK